MYLLFFYHFVPNVQVNMYNCIIVYVNTTIYEYSKQIISFGCSLFKLNTNLSNNKHDSHGLQLKINYKIWIEMVNRTLLLSNNFIGKWTHNNRFSNEIAHKISSMSNNKSKYSEWKPINLTELFTYGTPADVARVQNTPHFIRY